MRLQHYNAATRGGTGNRGTADVQAPYERKRRRNPWLGLDGLFRSGSHLLVFAGSEIGPLLGVKNLVLCLQNARGVLDATGAPLAYRPQGKDSLDVERVQLVGVRQGLEQLVQALRQPPRAPPQPPTGRISCPEDLDAHSRSHPARPRPFDPKPAPALLGRAGSHAGRRPARAATLFRVLRPMRCAREQREKLTSGDFYNHVRLRFLPCRRARAACDSRDARHATGAGLRA